MKSLRNLTDWSGDRMRLYYDFHIHTCLSPCGDADMTPNNVVNMALIKGLDAIAVTDHNSCKNAQALMQVGAEAGLLVLPGMEIESCEEVHVVALFETIEACSKMEALVRAALPPMQNNPSIFGEQWILNASDDCIGEEEQLLVTACALSVYEIVDHIHALGGVAIAAHVDKSAYSVISNLGFLPPDLSFDAAELSKNAESKGWGDADERLCGLPAIHSSDAHYLGDISEPKHILEAETKEITSVLEVIRKKS